MVYKDPTSQDEGDVLTGTRVCKECGTRKNMIDFHWIKKGLTRRRKCKKCCSDAAQSLRDQDPEKYRVLGRMWQLKGQYGLTDMDFHSMMVGQGKKCAICREPFGDISTVHVDHDHNKGCCGPKKACKKCIRGLLCFGCNTGIGKLKDDPVLLRRAADYVEKEEG